VTASALTSVAALASGRVVVAIGAGFTGRFTLALPPVPIARLQAEVSALRTLLAGHGRRPSRVTLATGS
jgi:5,10-methylenetetrahydromethanopterin reductase